MPDQLNLSDVLAALNPRLVVEMEAEPGWAWMACPICAEIRYLRRSDAGGRCMLTINCSGRMEVHLGLDCRHCAKPVTARRSGKDTRFCSEKCARAFAAECQEFGCHEL